MRLTPRDFFAASCISAALMKYDRRDDAARSAYRMADEMLKTRKIKSHKLLPQDRRKKRQ